MAQGVVTGTYRFEFDLETASVWELLEQETKLKSLIAAAEGHAVDVPQSMRDKLDEISTKVDLLNTANLKRQVSEAKARVASRKTNAQKDSDDLALIAALEAKLVK